MQILVFLLFVLFSFEWYFTYSLIIQKAGDPQSNVAENSLKAYLRALHAKPKFPKIHFRWVKPTYWKEKKEKFKFCDRTRGEKLHLCRQVLGSKEYGYLEIDGTRPDPTPCKKRTFKFYDTRIDGTEGKQILPMYPCILRQELKERYFLSNTGDEDPSMYLFHEEPYKDANGKYPIYFSAKITGIEMNLLADAREAEKKRQKELYGNGPIAEVDEAADQGPLVPV